MRNKKGVAGLEILLSVVVVLFIIGFLVFIFAILGGELTEEAKEYFTASVTNETIGIVKDNTTSFDYRDTYTNVICTDVVCSNASGADTIFYPAPNYTISDCRLTGTTAVGEIQNNTPWNCSYAVTAYRNQTASDVIFESTDELAEVTDWFGIIIVITAMLVLMLLTVIIIQAIKGTGIVALGGESGERITPTETA